MSRYIALFRGINVGGHHKLPMKELTGLLEGLGCRQVRTWIQSGNVVFDADDEDVEQLSARITAAVEAAKGFAPRVWLMSGAALGQAIAQSPWPLSEGKHLHFFFLESAPDDPDLGGLGALKAASESFELIGDVFYLHAPEGIGRSKLADRIGQYLRVPMTARNGNTVAKLGEMLED